MVDNNIVEAVNKLLEDSKSRNFEESVDLAINLKNLDLSQPKNRIDEEIILPHGLGKERKVAVFAKGDVALKAKNSGADYIFSEEDINELATDKSRARALANECSFFIAEAQYMPMIGKALGTVLGPRGKMPTPLTGDKDIISMINSLKNSIRVRSKDKQTFHVSVGIRNLDPNKVAENVETVLYRIENALEKGKHNLKSVYITTTMGSSVRVV
ncbi:50S ribosomal protein L1 [Methanosalsum natronophilum]|uniref:Large ribosomal subunit protein uL1 n=1 Tax=Methanosalsum natronophilum TaxID=768733 RepID=A0A3R7XJ26_9EURY|nr:50S ribosomal protein L1 [Methanosalsum natronophilum]MCS3923434.1 large subunit ribosomal protein L1 [Methanosalsum natronophilum]RQD90814.1 MAG: 50S ribosomal protein L1 [Methanosalsum natronophilum]